MTEAEYQNSEQYEVTPQYEAEATPTEHHESQEPEQTRESEQERNWRAARERIAALEAETKRKDELLEKALSTLGTKPEPQVEDEPDLPDDEYATYGQFKKSTKKLFQPFEKKIEELEQKLAQKEQQEMFHNLKRKYSDFEDVVNAETIALFEKKEPELAASISKIKDINDMTLQTYKMIKALNIAEDIPTRRRQKETEEKLDKNAKTVQSPQAFDKRPMAQAFKMTEADKSKLYDEMMGFASMASSALPMQ